MPEDRSILTRAAGPADRVLSYGPAPWQLVEFRFAAGRTALANAPGQPPLTSAPGRPLLVLVHGGFWRPQYDRAHLRPMAEALAAAGWTTALVEYDRVPGEPDRTVGDIALALRRVPALTDRHDGRVVVLGHSAGGQLALWAAAQADAGLRAGAQTDPALSGARADPGLSAVVALGAVADLRLADELGLDEGAVRAFLGADAATRPDLDPRLSPPRVPITLIHGRDDAIVPPSLAQSYVRAHPDARLVTVEGAGHYALIDPARVAWCTVLAELERVSGPSPDVAAETSAAGD